jgi:hypothetical protein
LEKKTTRQHKHTSHFFLLCLLLFSTTAHRRRKANIPHKKTPERRDKTKHKTRKKKQKTKKKEGNSTNLFTNTFLSHPHLRSPLRTTAGASRDNEQSNPRDVTWCRRDDDEEGEREKNSNKTQKQQQQSSRVERSQIPKVFVPSFLFCLR